jgi:phosphatidylglycerol:prolipoprotein diacylglycerol transferase
MHPILFRVGSLEIHTYGVLVALGFMLGLAVAVHNGKRERIDPERINELGLWLIAAGMVGGKLFHVIFFWREFIEGWREAGIASLRQGFVFYGGFICAVLAAIWYARRKHLPFPNLADALAPGVALGHAFGRFGCFFEGCCYGKYCTAPWAVHFPAVHPTAGAPIHPTELYEAAGNLAIFVGLMLFYRRKSYAGQITWIYVLSYAALRFVVEFFRGDYTAPNGLYAGRFTIGHIIAAVMIVVALAAMMRRRRLIRT